MEKTHWKKLNNPDYLGAYALEPGKDLIATIKTVRREMVTGQDGKKTECTVAHFQDKAIKPMILNATNCKTIQKLYKTPYVEDWAGRSIQIYIDSNIRVAGETVEGLRVRAFVPKRDEPEKNEPIFCADCGAEIQPFGKMSAAKMAVYTYEKYGKSLCADCAQAEKDKTEIKDPLAVNEPTTEREEPNENNEN